jgi:hypothetical protein
MEQEKLSEKTTPPVANELNQSAFDSQEQQMSELKELTRSLMQSVQAIQVQNSRNAKFDETMADLKATARAMLVSPNTGANYSQAEAKDCCGDGPCGCVSKSCCCFEIVLSKARAAKPQIEPADLGDVPGLINALEVQIYVTNENIGFLWPGLATTMDLRADGAPGGPGPWVIIERVINRVYVKKGTNVTTEVNVEVREHDEGVERPIGLKDEIGEGSGLISLDCCMSKIYPQMPIDIPLVHGGEGKGMIQVAFYARRVCC